MEDIQKALSLARQFDLRVAIKNTGHSLPGASSAPNSLLIYTHNLKSTRWHKYLSTCGVVEEEVVEAAAGVQYFQLYNEAQIRGRFIVGGACSTVGHAGFAMGGGYGLYTRLAGSGAQNIVRATVLLADGQMVHVLVCPCMCPGPRLG